MAPATTNLVALNMDWNLHLGDWVAMTARQDRHGIDGPLGPASRARPRRELLFEGDHVIHG